MTKKIYTHKETKEQIEYTYDEDDSLIKISLNNQNVNYIYDSLGRLKEKNINNQLPLTYEYERNGNKTSLILKRMTIDNIIYDYKYDNLYNITDIYKNKELINHYEYDTFNELIKEDNYLSNKTITYTYDNSGNILKREEYEINTDILIHEDNFAYTNTNWKDQLTRYNDTNIIYDEIGNPITIGDKNLSWNARELQSYQDNMSKIEYFYNKEGIRTQKRVNNVETNYFVENSNIIMEETNGNMLYYMRTGEHELIGLKYNNATYYYQKNYQGDIIGIYNEENELIATYEYDSYGKILSIKDANGNPITDQNHIANRNPFRYRSYYYDTETKLYYLNSRYYNPEWGRFLNADGIIGTSENYLGYNLYTYCENNPINKSDPDGNIAGALALGFGGLVLGAATKAFIGIVAKAAVVVTCAVVTASAVKSIANTKTNASSKKQKENHNVYVLKDPVTQKVEYVGRTTNVQARRSQHNLNTYKKELEMIVEYSNVPYEVARVKEQELIIKYQTLNRGNYRNNQINGLNFNNPKKYMYFDATANYFGEETYVGGIEW